MQSSGSVGTSNRRGDDPLAVALDAAIAGEVRFDPLSRTIYATDAGIHEIIPRGAVLPKHVDDVIAIVNTCREYGTSVIARGAGTGLTGGAVGDGVQIDLSRYMDRIGAPDLDARTIEVEPGAVLADINARVAAHGLHFAPDVATSSRATIGGMIANNSCGAHSILYGRTVDHVLSLTVVLGDGEVVSFSTNGHGGGADGACDTPLGSDRAVRIEQALGEIRNTHWARIQRRFPHVLRSNGGYGLDRLGEPGTRAAAVKVLCGSEGTLGIVVKATLALTPLPKHRALVVFQYDDLLEALGPVPAMLAHRPAAVELIDHLIIGAGMSHPATRRRCGFLEADAAAMILVELFDDDAELLASRVAQLCADSAVRARCWRVLEILDAREQRAVWDLREAGLGLLMSRPGDRQPYAFVEDAAVDPVHLRDYIGRLQAVLRAEGVDAGYYAHASVGCLHVRPVLNLKQAADVERMRRIADAASDLVLEFGGAMTGEHGDGIVRSCWLEKMYGPEIVQAFAEVKSLFDPDAVLNPHKIVAPLPMTEHLRQGPSFQAKTPSTLLDFSVHGGMAGLAGMCTGVAQCRRRGVETMCPSFMATCDEQHTTRARANALRAALSNRGLLDGLDDPHLADVMDLCLSCKACKSECPTGVDMARLKSEYLFHRHLRHGVPRRARFVADAPRLAAIGSRFPALANLVAGAKPVRAWVERRYGLDRRIAPPRLARRTFRAWYRRHRRGRDVTQGRRGQVVYFVDTWTNYFLPQVGVAAVTLLERAGYEVLCPATPCCGRPAISQGLLAEARQQAEGTSQILSRYARDGLAIVGTEPSCILTLKDEHPQLVRTQAAQRVADKAQMIESFLQRAIADDADVLQFRPPDKPVLYHSHCHQEALVGSDDAMSLLSRAWGSRASMIGSGCCGMAGSFGAEREHYDVARSVGEDRLFPAIRERGDAQIAVSGFSCRQQIEHHTDARPKHVVEWLAACLA